MISSPVLGIYPRTWNLGQEAVWCPVFTTALSTAAEVQQQHRCPWQRVDPENMVCTLDGMQKFVTMDEPGGRRVK